MADNKISILITAKDDASRVLEGLSTRAESSSRAAAAMGLAWKGAKIGVAAAGAAALASAKEFGDFEQGLNIFQAVSQATDREMQKVAATARELGKDVTLPGVSSKDAALAMTELAKAGLSVNDALAASKGVLSLAKAGQLDTAQAAEVAANALNAFGLKGSEANKVADILASAANASSAGVGDLAMALQMTSASAASLKVPLADTVALLGEMANNGIKGSDAGTSLKTFLAALTPTTTDAKEAMKELNLQFFNARGEFVGMREVTRQLQEGTKSLTAEQKAQKLETIFGSDAVRAANIIVKEGIAGYDEMRVALERQGAAAELAAAQNKGLKGSYEAFKSTVQTIATDFGSRIAPTLAQGLDFVTERLGGVTLANDEMTQSLGTGVAQMSLMEIQTRNKTQADTAAHEALLALQAAEAQEPALAAAAANARELVRQKQVALTDAVAQYGPQSDQARALTAELESAQYFLNQRLLESAEGMLNVTNRTNAYRDAMLRAGDASRSLTSLTAALKDGMNGLEVEMGQVQVQATRTADTIQGAFAPLPGMLYNLNGQIGLVGQSGSNAAQRLSGEILNVQQQATQLNDTLNRSGPVSNRGLRVTPRAAGGPVSAGQPYLVGDNPDGSINSTTELFVPKQSGTIIPADKTRDLLSGSGSGVFIQSLNVNNNVDPAAVIRQIGWQLAIR